MTKMLKSQMTSSFRSLHRDEAMAPFIPNAKWNYIFGGICGVAANASIKALVDMKSINLFGVQQICRNAIASEQALASIPSINSEAVQERLDRVRTYYELLNMAFEARPWLPSLQNIYTFHPFYGIILTQYLSRYGKHLNIQVPGREIPTDAQYRLSEILSM